MRTLNAGPNPRYFGPGRGVTYVNFLSDQFAGLHAIVVAGTLRDSLYIFDGLLDQPRPPRAHDRYRRLLRPGLRPGYQFSPRLADIGADRFWCTDRTADSAR